MADYQWAVQTMADARVAVAQNHKKLSTRIKTKLFWKGRKALMHAPRELVTAPAKLLSKIPVVGDVVAKSFEVGAKLALDQYLTKLKEDKTKAYTQHAKELKEADKESDAVFTEALRKAAKWQAKTLKDIAEHIDGNMPKLKAATEELQKKLKAYPTDGTAPDFSELWELAIAIYEKEHYEAKLLADLAIVESVVASVKAHIENSSKSTMEFAAVVTNAMAQLGPEIAVDKTTKKDGYVELK